MPKQKSLESAFTGKSDLAVPTPEKPDMKKRKMNDGGAVAGSPAAKVGELKIAVAAAPNPTEIGPMSLWTGAAGDPKALISPAFDPELVAADFPAGKPVGFALVSDALRQIEALKGSGCGSRKKSTVILSNVFRTLLYSQPKDLVPTLYILINKVAPDFEDAELGVGDGGLIRAMCEVFGRSEVHMKNSIINGEANDLGEVALLSRVSQKVLFMPPKLSIEKVFAEMKAIAACSGKDSGKIRKEKISKMLVASRGEEAKFIVRMLQGKLRIGIQIPTVLQAIAYAFQLTVPARGGEAAVGDVRNVKGKKKPTVSELEVAMTSMEEAVKRAFSEMPDFERVTSALMAGHNGETLGSVCHISLGIPVKPMLAKPSKGLGEVGERMAGKRFTGEYKYDGERAQIHVISRDDIRVYSRNSQNMTEKYPDVIKVVQDSLCDNIQSCVIDSELVAYDQVAKKILPFQILSTRGSKNVSLENLKCNVCIYPFDCMLLNGTPMVRETLEKRRDALWSILKPTEGKVIFATYQNFDDLQEETIQAFLDESIAASCEGLMLKTLVDSATYQPSKRSLNWLKLKKDYLDGVGDTLDVVPIGAFYGKGKRTGSYGAFLLAIYNEEEEEFQTVCKAGTGFSDEDLVTHYEFYKERTTPVAESNYNVSDRMKPDVWLEACQVWEIKCADLSISPVHTSAMGMKAPGKGIGLRFPRFLRIRDDKGPEDATNAEQVADMFENQAVIGKDGGGDDE